MPYLRSNARFLPDQNLLPQPRNKKILVCACAIPHPKSQICLKYGGKVKASLKKVCWHPAQKRNLKQGYNWTKEIGFLPECCKIDKFVGVLRRTDFLRHCKESSKKACARGTLGWPGSLAPCRQTLCHFYVTVFEFRIFRKWVLVWDMNFHIFLQRSKPQQTHRGNMVWGQKNPVFRMEVSQRTESLVTVQFLRDLTWSFDNKFTAITISQSEWILLLLFTRNETRSDPGEI